VVVVLLVVEGCSVVLVADTASTYDAVNILGDNQVISSSLPSVRSFSLSVGSSSNSGLELSTKLGTGWPVSRRMLSGRKVRNRLTDVEKDVDQEGERGLIVFVVVIVIIYVVGKVVLELGVATFRLEVPKGNREQARQSQEG
jgi:hypothetical protein